jgi:RNA polymerase sigma-70 factor (ECF subfamily)
VVFAGKLSEVSVSREALFQSLYEHQQSDVLAYFLRRLGREDAVEATADVFLTAWRRIDDTPDGADARRWLFGIAHNVLRNRQRTNRRIRRLVSRMATVSVDPEPTPETMVLCRAQDREVLEALDRLRPSDREVIRLRLWEEASYEEIAAMLGCSRHAAEQRYAKALRRLRSACRRAGHVRTGRTKPALPAQEHTREA